MMPDHAVRGVGARYAATGHAAFYSGSIFVPRRSIHGTRALAPTLRGTVSHPYRAKGKDSGTPLHLIEGLFGMAVVAVAQRSCIARRAGAFDSAKEVGVTAPLGYFDPVGFCKGDETGFRSFRAAEIKHGRVAMMAALGAVVQHFVTFPGFESLPRGLAAVSSPPGNYGFIAMLALVGILELFVWAEDPSAAPGNFGDPLGLNQYSDDMRNRELNNGRFAMFAAVGIITAELLTGKDGIEQLGL